ncbi:MAG: ATP synthase F1 subunit delta [Pseudomonadota bacterium]
MLPSLINQNEWTPDVAKATAEMNKIGLRYAQALLDVCLTEKATESVAADMASVAGLLDGKSDFAAFVRHPLLSAAQRDAIILDVAKKTKMHKVSVNFLRTLADNGRLNVLPAIVTLFPKVMAAHSGILQADVASAYKLSATQESDIAAALTKAMGAKVALNVAVDKTLLGGLTIRVGSVVIDDSVAGKLQRMRRGLNSAANANQHSF